MSKIQVADTVHPTLISFKPRQVLLSRTNMKQYTTTTANGSSHQAQKLKPDRKAVLLHSIAHYLATNGFSITLKKFRSEAQIAIDDLSNSSLDLEEMYCKFLEKCNHDRKNVDTQKSQDVPRNGSSKEDGKSDKSACVPELDEPDLTLGNKKKRKSKLVSESLVDNAKCQQLDSLTGANEKKSVDVPPEGKKLTDSEIGSRSKDKKKKKKEASSDSLVEIIEPHDLEVKIDTKNSKELKCSKDAAAVTTMLNANGIHVEDKEAKSKSKSKKKKDSLVSEAVCGSNSKELQKEVSLKGDSKMGICKTFEENLTSSESKHSKKRKRLASEENISQPEEKKVVEESKRRKTEDLEEFQRVIKGSVKESNGKDDQGELNGLADRQQTSGNLEKNVEQSSIGKSKKQENGSVEPKSATRFQRVNIEEVVFFDERLKDNSYWAKDSAGSGYGAKAQEVLQQVRGRDFRHEKTKKKRGSYRGGQIDLQSHSIKFNYSDDE